MLRCRGQVGAHVLGNRTSAVVSAMTADPFHDPRLLAPELLGTIVSIHGSKAEHHVRWAVRELEPASGFGLSNHGVGEPALELVSFREKLEDDLRRRIDPDLWEAITPMARWEWVRWVKGRVDVSISKLSSGKRRPCCFNLAACTDPELSRNSKLVLD